MRCLHLVVQDFQVGAQHQPGPAGERNAREALPHGGLVGAGGDARVRVGHHARAAAGQGQGLHLAGGVGGVVHRAHLLLQRLAGCQQQAGRMGRGVAALQIERGALQVVWGVRGHQGLFVAGVGVEPGMDVVRGLVPGAGRGDAQVLQRGAGADMDMGVQVLRDALGALRGFALVGFDEHAVHAVLHLQHQQRRLGLRARLVAQL